jgi:hypothetical protein
MDYISSLLSLALFAMFVPGVLFTFPSKGSRRTVLITHAIAFMVVNTFVMRYYWVNIKGHIENMMNYGVTCPNGFVPNGDKSANNGEECIPAGQATYAPTGSVPVIPETSQ